MFREPHRATWLGSDRFLARSVVRPVGRLLAVEAAGGLLLVGATVVALVWANSPWRAGYSALWSTDLALGVGRHVLHEDLRHWVNDALMAIFFFVIGLEVKQELVHGDLRDPARAAVPLAGALGGMAVPAALYLVLSGPGAAGGGWGIPMATDVAFALGILALLGPRVPAELKLLLLALAVIDDIGAILVIAVFYSSELALGWLAAGGLLLLAIGSLRRVGVRYLPLYAVLGLGVWFVTYESGVHATIAGVALAFLVPARPLLGPSDASRIAGELSTDPDVTPAEVREVSFRLRESVAMTDRLLHVLHPWTSYVVVPLFALANAGVDLSAGRLADAAGSRVTLAVVVGLVAGKAVGVTAGIALVVRGGVGELPAAVRPAHVVGLGLVAGIGFTVSIFVAGLAFESGALVDDAKVGVLLASVVAATAAALVLSRADGRRAAAGVDGVTGRGGSA